MPLMPKRVTHRKAHKGKIKGVATRTNKLNFGDFGLMSLDLGVITAQQIDACRLSAQRFIGNEGKLIVRIFPHRPYTRKPQESHMGSGKGDPAFYGTIVRPGTIMYELSAVTEDFAKDCLARLAHKVSVRTKFVTR